MNSWWCALKLASAMEAKRRTTAKEMKMRLLTISINAISINFGLSQRVLEMKCGRREKNVVLGILMKGDGVYIVERQRQYIFKKLGEYFYSVYIIVLFCILTLFLCCLCGWGIRF